MGEGRAGGGGGGLWAGGATRHHPTLTQTNKLRGSTMRPPTTAHASLPTLGLVGAGNRELVGAGNREIWDRATKPGRPQKQGPCAAPTLPFTY